MKFSIINLALTALAAAVPTPTIDENSTPALVKRASITEACNIGYASTNGGTTGGHGGSTTTVSTLAQFTEAADSDTKRVIYVQGTIKGNTRIKVKSDKTIVGASGSKLEGVGLHITAAKNVIVRNLNIYKVKEAYGDAINVRNSRNIWIDHVDVSSDLDSGKDYYDGLIDINHGSDWITVSNSFLHDHWKTSLVGHSDSNAAEDEGKLHITYANNYWFNVNSRNPSVRFGTVHVYNNYYLSVGATGVNTRMGAQVRVESTVFEDTKGRKVILSRDSKSDGFATVSDVSYGGGENVAPKGDFGSSKVPYSYSLYGRDNVKDRVWGVAGQTLAF